MTHTQRNKSSTPAFYRFVFKVFLLLSLLPPSSSRAADNLQEPMTADEAISFVDEMISTDGCHFDDLLTVIESSENTFVVGLLAASNNIALPPTPTAEYVLRVWIDRNSRQILPSPASTNHPPLSVSNVVDIVRNEYPPFAYATNRVVTQLHLSETTITRFPARKPEIPPGYGWLGPDFAAIIWIDNATSNILFWLVGN